jgi:murein L,D-transpeptidase YcbB/YkuD
MQNINHKVLSVVSILMVAGMLGVGVKVQAREASSGGVSIVGTYYGSSTSTSGRGSGSSGLNSSRDVLEHGTSSTATSSGSDSARDAVEQALKASGAVNNNFHFENDLRIGTSSDDVKGLQVELGHSGDFHGPFTGVFGNITRSAVINFQREHGLPTTGFVGPLTRAALNKVRDSRISGSGQ